MQIDRNPSPETLRDFFLACFQEVPNIDRLAKASSIVFFSPENEPLAAACLEPDQSRKWGYIWLFAVAESARGCGLGARLLEAVVDEGRGLGLRTLSLKTYQKWTTMREMLERKQWVLVRAEASKREDGVGEIWQLPLVDSPLKIVVIGANPEGRGGEWISSIREQRERWQLVSAVDPDSAVREFWQSKGIPSCASWQDVPNPGEIDAAVIAVPPRFSAGIQKELLREDLALLVEKPLASSMRELLELQSCLAETKGNLVPGVQRRSHPAYVALRSVLADKAVARLSVIISLGRSESDRLSGHRSDPRQCRGGALLDLGYHALDLVHFLLGVPLEMISCSLQDRGDLASGSDSAADLLCRAGRTWVRVQVNRQGHKTEAVFAGTSEGVYRADRGRVTAPDGSVIYECPRAWHSSERSRLSILASARLCGFGAEADLWEHLALFEIIERAYGMSAQLGTVEA